MTDPLGNSEFCFPRLRLGKHWDSQETKFTVPLRTSHQVLIISNDSLLLKLSWYHYNLCVVQGKALMWWSLLWPLLSKAIVKGKPEQCLNPDHCQIQIRQEFWTWIILFWPFVFLGGKCSIVQKWNVLSTQWTCTLKKEEKLAGWQINSRISMLKL